MKNLAKNFLRHRLAYAGFTLVRSERFDQLYAPRDIMARLNTFVPHSRGTDSSLSNCALLGAGRTFPLLAELMHETGEVPEIENIEETFPMNEGAKELSALFTANGSDKSTRHDYHLVYGSLLNERRTLPIRLLEVGIGTNNPAIISTMGIDGKPGASLRAFRDFLPQGKIFGADIDSSILFRDERIETYFVDQTQPETFLDLQKRIGGELDIVIDDGLHAPDANLATMIFALRSLKSGGLFVVEDIAQAKLPVWQVVSTLLLPRSYKPRIVQAKSAALFIIRKP